MSTPILISQRIPTYKTSAVKSNMYWEIAAARPFCGPSRNETLHLQGILLEVVSNRDSFEMKILEDKRLLFSQGKLVSEFWIRHVQVFPLNKVCRQKPGQAHRTPENFHWALRPWGVIRLIRIIENGTCSTK